MRYPRVFTIRGQQWFFDGAGKLVWPPDPEPYAPCWCFSGKQFKFCHKNRHREPKATVGEVLTDWEASSVPLRCFAPDSPAGCSGPIIGSHVVQKRGGGLAAIARDGKVYGTKPHPMSLIKNDGRFEPELVGVNKASTFPGFCEHHDAELFREIETQPLSPTAQQLLRLNFRALARSIYSNNAWAVQLPGLHDADRGCPRDKQRRIFWGIEMLRLATQLREQRLAEVKHLYDQLINDAVTLHANALVIRLRGEPEFACSCDAPADVDFVGKDLPSAKPSDYLCFHSRVENGEVVVLFAWIGRNPAAEGLAHSFIALPKSEQPQALLRFAVEYGDSLFFKPAWWETLGQEHRKKLVDRMSRQVRLLNTPPTNALCADGSSPSKLTVTAVEAVGISATSAATPNAG